MRKAAFALLLLAACGTNEAEPIACEEAVASEFSIDSGWGSADYCAAPTDLGCFPFHESAVDTCGPFTTMRTSATSDAAAAACQTIVTSLNCGIYESEDKSSRLTFNLGEPDKFMMRVRGKYQGADVDTIFYFNPCHQNCQAAITLKTLDPDQQKICDIPRQGKPACLFPETAHSMTFVRADGGSLVIRTAGEETAMARVGDAM